MIAVGNEFHIVTDRYRKDRYPVADLYPEISNLFLFLASRSCTVALVTKREQRYRGASPLTHLNVRLPTAYINNSLHLAPLSPSCPPPQRELARRLPNR